MRKTSSRLIPELVTHVQTWDALVDWRYVLPPSRPAYWQLEITRRFLRTRNRREPVAVLGSTPEFRDLLAEMEFRSVYIFEKNLQFHKRMKQFRCYENREQLVRGDWLQTLPDYANTFCAILSDLTSGNLPYNKRDSFYRLISRALRPGAAFIDKVLRHPMPHDRLATLEHEFIRLPVNLDTINRFSCKFFFCSELLEIRSEVDSSLFYDILVDRFSHPKLKALLKGTRLITPSGCHWWYGVPWRKASIPYFGHLRVLKSVEDLPDSPYARRCKLYLLARR